MTTSEKDCVEVIDKVCVVCAENKNLHEFINLRLQGTIEITLKPELMDALVEFAMKRSDWFQWCLTKYNNRGKLCYHDEIKSCIDRICDIVGPIIGDMISNIELLNMIVEKRRQNITKILFKEEQGSEYFRHQIDRLCSLITEYMNYIFKKMVFKVEEIMLKFSLSSCRAHALVMSEERNTKEAFQSTGYLVVRNFFETKSLFEYSNELSIKSTIGVDTQVPGSLLAYCDPIMEEPPV